MGWLNTCLTLLLVSFEVGEISLHDSWNPNTIKEKVLHTLEVENVNNVVGWKFSCTEL